MGPRPKNTVKSMDFEWPRKGTSFVVCWGNRSDVCAIDFGVKQVHPPKQIEHVHFLTIFWWGIILFYLFGDFGVN